MHAALPCPPQPPWSAWGHLVDRAAGPLDRAMHRNPTVLFHCPADPRRGSAVFQQAIFVTSDKVTTWARPTPN